MIRINFFLKSVTDSFNWISAAGVTAMMLLTSADVFLRLVAEPIPGVYEIVGLLGCIVVSFSLAYTSAEKGHIAVEFLMRKLPDHVQAAVNTVNNLLSIALFGLIARQCLLYAADLRQSGEVTLTLQMPIFPFVYGISIGCTLLCLVLASDFFKSARRMFQR